MSESLNQSGGFNVGEEEEVSVVMVVVVVGALSSTFLPRPSIFLLSGESAHTL